MRTPASGTDATMVPLRRHMEQSHRRGSTIPSGRSSSRTTAPQWQEARCLAPIAVPPTDLIIAAIGSLARRVHLRRGLDQRLEGLLVHLVALVEIDGAARVAFQARVEKARRILNR